MRGGWAELLAIDPSDPPAWRWWAALFSFVSALDEWSRALPADSAFVLASEARDPVAAHRPALERTVELPAVERYRGEAFLGAFVQALHACAEFMDRVVSKMRRRG